MDKCLKSPFLCYFFVYRCRFASMKAFVPNRVDLLFSSESICIMPASCADLLDVFCIVSSIWANRQLLFVIWESCFWIACMLSESDVRFIGFKMCLLKSFINRESSFDVKRGIRCDGLVWFMHRVRKSDAWSDNAYFISAQIRCGAAHLSVVWLFNLCLFLSDVTWLCAYFIADILPNAGLILQSLLSTDSPCLNRMPFAICYLFAFQIGCCWLLAFSLLISIYIIAQFTFVN